MIEMMMRMIKFSHATLFAVSSRFQEQDQPDDGEDPADHPYNQVCPVSPWRVLMLNKETRNLPQQLGFSRPALTAT
ncbi:unnamed protein product [Vitrella brassicaformis CCMP3155]|uniref:Uncharacterized protein n=1 Tax=Vitrella brassicaformis (strain CCMP3155) TaxID=1169540 RepID=A0A0G4E9X2_VITBC|nr:unnamed protein product [Vitrella brassicaformis CCMP3155]|eukprot:CEL92725.1 unnamed protein product [Vitrella brassicaformis CCMP3155]